MTRKRLGTVLLIAGISAWAVYYALKLLTPIQPPFASFLIWHLSGVIPGALLRGSKILARIGQLLPGTPEVENEQASAR